MSLNDLYGLGASALGAFCIYLAAPQQRCWSVPWPRWIGRSAGGLLLLLGWCGLADAAQPLAATYVWITWLMLVFVALPYLGALINPSQGR